jgi:hypothetical protein
MWYLLSMESKGHRQELRAQEGTTLCVISAMSWPLQDESLSHYTRRILSGNGDRKYREYVSRKVVNAYAYFCRIQSVLSKAKIQYEAGFWSKARYRKFLRNTVIKYAELRKIEAFRIALQYIEGAQIIVCRASGSMSNTTGKHAPKVAGRGVIGETEIRRRLESDNAEFVIFSGSYHVVKSIETDKGFNAEFQPKETYSVKK